MMYRDSAEEYARMTLQLAEIALFAKDSKKATSSFTEALAAWHTLEKSPSQQMRLAANQLLLAMLQQSQGEKQASASYLMARKALDEVPQEKVNRDHLTLLKAMLNYREAQNHSAAGEYAKALDQLRAATRQFHELITARPDVARLRSELSECFLASANVLESMNDFGNAREVRALAVIEINKLIKSHPNDIAVQLTLCETYTAMAHAALIAGDSLSVDQLSENAITILKKVLSQEPQNFIAATKLAAQHYFRATLHEDIGDAAKAISSVDDGLKLLEFAEMAEVSPDAQNTDALPRYYRALLLWQKGRLLGGNSRVQESALQNEALEILRNLKTNQQHPQLRSEHILMNLAQLLSDMAHVSHIDQKKDSAKEFFLAAAKEWETLAKLQPDNIDYRNAADWCRERIKEL
jgi:eukaryotic-like serine/threonine-protein kinase